MIRALSLAVCLCLVAQVFALPTDCPGCLTASELEAEDFTDSGVGCIDDCTAPALELFTDPETVPDEYTLEHR